MQADQVSAEYLIEWLHENKPTVLEGDVRVMEEWSLEPTLVVKLSYDLEGCATSLKSLSSMMILLNS